MPCRLCRFGKVMAEGIDVVDALNSEYGETAGSGIRSGQQGPLYEQGNAWLKQNFPRLEYIRRATIAGPITCDVETSGASSASQFVRSCFT